MRARHNNVTGLLADWTFREVFDTIQMDLSVTYAKKKIASCRLGGILEHQR